MSGNTISAKAKSMYGKCLKESDYKEMLHRSSVSDVAAYLKETPAYGSALTSIDPHNVHRGQLENLLMRELFSKYIKLCRYNFTGSDDFYNYLVLRYEIEQILKCILSLNAGTMDDFILDLPSFLINHASFDLLKLAKVRDFDGLISVLSHTPYREILLRFAPKGEPINYIACERALMTFHYDHLLTVIRKKFRGQTRKDLEKVVQINVTLSNLMTIYRLKRYFSAAPDDVKEAILPFSFKLNKTVLQKMVEAKTADDFFAVFEQCYYGMNNKVKEDNLEFEHHLDRIIYSYNKKLMRFSTSPPAVLYAFIILINTEIKNIIKIVEGIRYQIPSAQIQDLLIY